MTEHMKRQTDQHKPGELIESMELFEEVKEKLLFGNAMEWLGRK